MHGERSRAAVTGFQPIFFHRKTAISDPLFRVLADLPCIDLAQADAATVHVPWAVRAMKDGSRKSGQTFKREPVDGNDHDALMAAHERAFVDHMREHGADADANVIF
ncbi:MAG: hypothetical protein V4632_16870 [Pseudomonadota bacterium]